MFKWKKLGRIFNPADIKNISWLKEFAQAPAVLVFDDFIRVYFSCRPLPDENGQYVSYSAYIDLNRKNLFERGIFKFCMADWSRFTRMEPPRDAPGRNISTRSTSGGSMPARGIFNRGSFRTG